MWFHLQLLQIDISHHASIKNTSISGWKYRKRSWNMLIFTLLLCFCVTQCVFFLASRVFSGPRCQSSHQSAGLLLHRSAAQWSYTWAGPRCGSVEVKHTLILQHNVFQCQTAGVSSNSTRKLKDVGCFCFASDSHKQIQVEYGSSVGLSDCCGTSLLNPLMSFSCMFDFLLGQGISPRGCFFFFSQCQASFLICLIPANTEELSVLHR